MTTANKIHNTVFPIAVMSGGGPLSARRGRGSGGGGGSARAVSSCDLGALSVLVSSPVLDPALLPPPRPKPPPPDCPGRGLAMPPGSFGMRRW